MTRLKFRQVGLELKEVDVGVVKKMNSRMFQRCVKNEQELRRGSLEQHRLAGPPLQTNAGLQIGLRQTAAVIAFAYNARPPACLKRLADSTLSKACERSTLHLSDLRHLIL